jgi:uncharacterized membrane protein YhaH (DUF805 family)
MNLKAYFGFGVHKINRIEFLRSFAVYALLALFLFRLMPSLGFSQSIIKSSIVAYYVLAYVSLAQKRVRDIGINDGWALLVLVPYVNLAAFLFLAFAKGKC